LIPGCCGIRGRLAAFEAVTALPAAAVQLDQARVAADRITAVAGGMSAGDSEPFVGQRPVFILFG
jgi:hypothetical protein